MGVTAPKRAARFGKRRSAAAREIIVAVVAQGTCASGSSSSLRRTPAASSNRSTSNPRRARASAKARAVDAGCSWTGTGPLARGVNWLACAVIARNRESNACSSMLIPTSFAAAVLGGLRRPPAPSSNLSSAPSEAPASSRGASRWFYVGMAVAILVAELAGFSRSYRERVAAGDTLSLAAELHAVLFAGWLAIFCAQTILIATRNVRVHRRLGLVATLWATTMVLTGPPLAVDLARRGLPPGTDPLVF